MCIYAHDAHGDPRAMGPHGPMGTQGPWAPMRPHSTLVLCHIRPTIKPSNRSSSSCILKLVGVVLGQR